MSSMDLSNMSAQDMKEYIELLEAELEQEKKERAAEAAEYKALENEYESEIDKKNRELAQARGKIISQEITLASYKDKVGVPVIIAGTEHDLYKGEQKDFVRNLLLNAIQNYDKYTRSYKICESLLEANQEVGQKTKIQNTISSVLKNYTGMSKDIIQTLSSVGIGVDDSESKHYRLSLNGDTRYVVTISHTPSDSRCGLNAITDINRNFF